MMEVESDVTVDDLRALRRFLLRIYFNGKALKRAHLPSANHYDIVNREAYWVSGIKKDGLDRHWAGSGKVAIEAGVVEEYLRVIGSAELDLTRFEVIKDIEPTDPAKFHDQENARGPFTS